jgi:hypothetical protein
MASIAAYNSAANLAKCKVKYLCKYICIIRVQVYASLTVAIIKMLKEELRITRITNSTDPTIHAQQ